MVAENLFLPLFQFVLMTLGYTLLLFSGPTLELKPPPFSACL